MANRRVLVKRRKSIRNIRKITRTMQLIATARFQASFNRAVAARPFTEKLAELVADLARAGGGLDHPLLKTRNPAAPAAVIVISSSRGLCGGYNSGILRTALGFLEERQASGASSEVTVFGKKGIAYFRFIKTAVHRADRPDQRGAALRPGRSRSPIRSSSAFWTARSRRSTSPTCASSPPAGSGPRRSSSCR